MGKERPDFRKFAHFFQKVFEDHELFHLKARGLGSLLGMCVLGRFGCLVAKCALAMNLLADALLGYSALES